MPFLPSSVPFLPSLPSSSFPHYPQIDDYARGRIITAITDRRVTDCRNKHKPALLNDPRDGSPFGMRGASDTVVVTNDSSGRAVCAALGGRELSLFFGKSVVTITSSHSRSRAHVCM